MWYFTPETFGLANTWCLAFPIGIFYAQYKNIKDHKNSYIRLILSIVILSLCIFLKANMEDVEILLFNHRINFWLYTLITNIAYGVGSYCVLIIVKTFELKWLVYIGKISFYIYLLHTPLITTPINVLSTYNSYIIMIVGFMLMVISLYIIARYKHINLD